MAPWHRSRSAPPQRRSGPEGEDPWWDPADQAFVEQPVLGRRDLGRGWVPALMLNNEERLDPYGDDPRAEILRAERAARRLTALDEGVAYRQRSDGALAVLRVELFASGDLDRHRLAWREHGAACLQALWAQRWEERERDPGWIEARWRDERDRAAPLGPVGGDVVAPVAAAIDWIVVEDQTGTAETEVVTEYQHLTVWVDRAVATITLRHPQHLPLDATAATAAATAHARLLAQPA